MKDRAGRYLFISCAVCNDRERIWNQKSIIPKSKDQTPDFGANTDYQMELCKNQTDIFTMIKSILFQIQFCKTKIKTPPM